MFDIHTHILPNIDDGSSSIEDSMTLTSSKSALKSSEVNSSDALTTPIVRIRKIKLIANKFFNFILIPNIQDNYQSPILNQVLINNH